MLVILFGNLAFITVNDNLASTLIQESIVLLISIDCFKSGPEQIDILFSKLS